MENHAIDSDEEKVVKVTSTYFQLGDGRVFEHVIELDEVPSVEEFQKMYDHWKKTLKNGSPIDIGNG